ncbi:hypothetical protein ACE103_08645 [Bradyrhizobium sp. ma5]|uniref:hypothetical protein n=1 Tax=Bradyrhizobium sp. ma5 TaxID=3344828 RepID=UPI0035D44065
MISIARELDSYDIAQEIRQERQIHKGAFLLLEGDRDIKRFSKFVDENACSIQNCFGRENLLGAIELLIDEGFPGVLGLADADFDRLNGCLARNEAVIYSETHDFDLDISRSDVLRRYLDEVANQEKCAVVGGHEAVRTWVYDACRPLSVLRHISHTQKMGYRLDRINHGDICVDWVIDVRLLVEHVSTGRYAVEQRKQEMSRRINNHLAGRIDDEQLTNGHDFFAMLGLALQDKFGNRRPAQAWASEVEMHFRLAFSEDDFVGTNLFLAILIWQDENKPYLILKASLIARDPRNFSS